MRFAVCSGNSVNIRAGAGTQFRILAVAHKGDLMIAHDGDDPNWKTVAVGAGDRLVLGSMSAKYIEYIGT